MKLYQTLLSPFPARVRLSLYAKGIDAEFVEPPGFGMSGASKGDYLRLNPMGRVPTLVLEDGRALPESEVICEYLEERYPTPSLYPVDPWQRARVRLLSRICDTYVVMAMVPLFDTIGVSRKQWNRETIDRALGKIAEALGFLEVYIDEHGYANGRSLTVADGVIPPMLMLACEWAQPLFGGPDPLGGLPRLSAYRTAVENDPVVARVMGEMREALRARIQRRTSTG